MNVDIVMTKWPDRPRSRVAGEFLGEDEHGRWYGSHRGRFHRASSGAIEPSVHVSAYHADLWWIPVFVAPGRRFDIYTHIATPPTFVDGLVSTIDLELDVVRHPDGSVVVLDADELEHAIVTYAMPAEVVADARAACERVTALMRASAAPFDGTGAAWFERYANGA